MVFDFGRGFLNIDRFIYMNYLTKNKGVLYALSSGLLYGLVGYFGMNIIALGCSIYSMLFWRFFTASLIVLVTLFFLPKEVPVNFGDAGKSFFYGGVFYSISTVIYFFASKYVGTGLAMVIFFTYPALVMVINWFLYNKRPVKEYYIAIAVITAGLVLLADFNALAVNAMGIILGVISAAGYAAYIVFSKKINLPPVISTLMVSAGCATTCLILALIDGSFVIPSTHFAWINIAGISIICTVVPIILLLQALKVISSEKASILSVLEPVFVVLVGIVLLDEYVTWAQIFGVTIVLGGALLSLLSNEKSKNN